MFFFVVFFFQLGFTTSLMQCFKFLCLFLCFEFSLGAFFFLQIGQTERVRSPRVKG